MNTETLNDTTPRVWVGCLGCYNSGSLNGKWIDGINADDISNAVNVVERASYFTPGETVTVCAKCGADEFWVFDHENFNGAIRGECSPGEAYEIAKALESIEDEMNALEGAFMAYLSLMGASVKDYAEHIDGFNDSYIGEFNSDRELGEHFIYEIGVMELPENIAPYFDFESYGRELGWDLMNESGHYFWNN